MHCIMGMTSASASATILLYILISVSISCIQCKSHSPLPIGPETRILGGTFADPGEFPHQVAVLIKTGTKIGICGGSILTSDYILTAAHCVNPRRKGEPPNGVKIVGGKHDITGLYNNPGIFGKQIIIHPCYDQNETPNSIHGFLFFNDIAIIKLDGFLTMGNDIEEIKIDDKDLTQDGITGQAIGWGRTNETETDPSTRFSPRLKKTNLTLNTKRWNDIEFSSSLKEGQIIGYNAVEFVCDGDSGGPLLCDDGTGANRNVLCGIASFGTDKMDGDCHGPIVFTRVFYYRKWIKDVLNGDYDSDEGCIGDRDLPTAPTTTPTSPTTIPASAATEPKSESESKNTSRGLPSQFVNHFICEICLTFIFLIFLWENQFF